MKKFPNALVIMIGFILFSAVLTYIVPQGEYERIINPDTNQTKVVPGSFEQIEAPSVSVFDILLSIPEGFIARADLIALILLIGASFFVIEKTGALKDGIEYLTMLLNGREEVALIVVSLAFLTGGALSGLQEEIIAMTPVLLYLSSRMATILLWR